MKKKIFVISVGYVTIPTPSDKKFVFNFDQDSNIKKITKSIEIVYGLRNFIGNANKFSKETVYITLKSDSEITEIIIEDDGNGYPTG